jgi:hypothetical protein
VEKLISLEAKKGVAVLDEMKKRTIELKFLSSPPIDRPSEQSAGD